MNNDFEHIQDILPEGAIPLTSLRIVSYLSDQGQPKYRFLWEGDGPSVDIIGILEVIKSELASEAYRLGGS